LLDYDGAIAVCDAGIAAGRENGGEYENIAKAHFRKAKALAKQGKWKECVASYDAGLLDFRDPASVKLRNQAEEKMKVRKSFFFCFVLFFHL
jgi:hypothetical protein